MTENELKQLSDGDIISHLGSGESYIVITGWPNIVAIRKITVTNPSEWELFSANPRSRQYNKELK